MRQIKFRGLSKNGEWVYGYYAYTSIFSNRNDYYKNIIITKNDYKEIDEGTQGMFTGLCDKNGKEIFDGDIVSGGKVVKWRGGAWGYDNIMYAEKIEIIGNIYENKDLLINK